MTRKTTLYKNETHNHRITLTEIMATRRYIRLYVERISSSPLGVRGGQQLTLDFEQQLQFLAEIGDWGCCGDSAAGGGAEVIKVQTLAGLPRVNDSGAVVAL